jgi:selenide,water dikinase
MAGLDKITSSSPVSNRVLTDSRSRDDAALYLLGSGQALVTTVDFGTPTSNNPAVWGSVSTQNALSDIYAMGGTPRLAMAILGLPPGVGVDLGRALIAASTSTLSDCATPLVGGHTILSDVPIFGLSVIGTVEANNAMLINNAKSGDFLVLTKPLGSGVIVAAEKAGVASEHAVNAGISLMESSNRRASELARECGVRAATDVSGYGLMGHLNNMLSSSGCSADIDFTDALILAEARATFEDCGTISNIAEATYMSLEQDVDWGSLPMATRMMLCDPQTSGGLLLSVHADALGNLLDSLRSENAYWAVLGQVTTEGPTRIRWHT